MSVHTDNMCQFSDRRDEARKKRKMIMESFFSPWYTCYGVFIVKLYEERFQLPPHRTFTCPLTYRYIETPMTEKDGPYASIPKSL